MPKVPPAFAGSIPATYQRYLGPYIFEPYAADLAARLDPSGIKTVLEIACGTGSVTAHLRKRLGEDARLVATDLNPDMLAIAKRTVPDPGIEWELADAQTLAFDDNYFDRVVCQFGLMFVPDRARAMTEIYRVLKPGGQLLMNTWDKLENNPAFYMADRLVAQYFPAEPPLFFHLPFSMHDEKELASLVGDAGFTDCRISLVKKEGVSASAAGTATGILEGTPIYTTINQRNPGFLPLLKKNLETELAARFGAAPMVSPMQAWVVEAKKVIFIT
ncbi:MAG TPA: class I SAM-dependent methyltransferase [Puia sp.]|jgi:ubiquinone/menaquinone biosynthesis C-methylase UbiE